jgi:hypothetical protein
LDQTDFEDVTMTKRMFSILAILIAGILIGGVSSFAYKSRSLQNSSIIVDFFYLEDWAGRVEKATKSGEPHTAIWVLENYIEMLSERARMPKVGFGLIESIEDDLMHAYARLSNHYKEIGKIENCEKHAQNAYVICKEKHAGKTDSLATCEKLVSFCTKMP